MIFKESIHKRKKGLLRSQNPRPRFVVPENHATTCLRSSTDKLGDTFKYLRRPAQENIQTKSRQFVQLAYNK